MSSRNLHDYCRTGEYDEAIKRALTHPEEAAVKGPATPRDDGMYFCYALHMLCYHLHEGKDVPLATIKAVYNAFPEALTIRNAQFRTPLHYAAAGNYDPGDSDDWSIEEALRTVEFFCRVCPDAAKIGDLNGTTPLHDLCDGRAIPVARKDDEDRKRWYRMLTCITKAYPDAATALSKMWVRPVVGAEETTPLDLLKDYHFGGIGLEGDIDDEPYFGSVCCMIAGCTKEEFDSSEKRKLGGENMIHKLCSCSHCPAEAIRIAMDKSPEEFRQKDGNGNYPFHLFLAQHDRLYVAHCSQCKEAKDYYEEWKKHSDLRGEDDVISQFLWSNAWTKDNKGGRYCGKCNLGYIASRVLKLCPQAASERDMNGRLPIHVCIERGLQWGDDYSHSKHYKDGGCCLLDDLVSTASETLMAKDSCTKLYPFMMAAMGESACLDTTYSLLRLCPELARFV